MSLLLALLIGAALVVFGAGGSIVTMPALVYAAGLDVHRAVGTSLLIVGMVALAGAVVRRRDIRLRIGAIFGGGGILGAAFGAWLNHQVEERLVLASFAVTLLLAAARMARPLDPASERAPSARCSPLAFATGIGVGVATGFFGVGGGFLVVPALILLLRLPMRTAVATSLFVISLNSAAGLAAHFRYGAVDWRVGLTFTAAALAGAAIALPLSKRLAGPALQRAFAGLLAATGIGILAQTLRALLA